MNDVIFHDNRRVKTTKYGGEFLAVTLQTVDDAFQDKCYLNRYCVPGRVDSYCFGYAPSQEQGFGPRIRFFTDSNDSLPKALKDVQADLDRPQVVEMLVKMCGVCGVRSLCENLIAVIAPKSKSLREMRKQLENIRQQKRQTK